LFRNYIKEEDFFESQTGGVISDSIVQNWTIQALECYKLKCDCKKCEITKAGYSFKCKMKNIIEILLKNLGKPDEKAILAQNKIKSEEVA